MSWAIHCKQPSEIGNTPQTAIKVMLRVEAEAPLPLLNKVDTSVDVSARSKSVISSTKKPSTALEQLFALAQPKINDLIGLIDVTAGVPVAVHDLFVKNN